MRIKNAPQLSFSNAAVTPAAFVGAALSFEHMRYNEAQTLLIDAPDGRQCGYINCYGLLLAACVKVGWLGPDFDLNLTPSVFGQSRERTLYTMLRLNANYFTREAGAGLGDILLLKYADNPKHREIHHVGIVVDSQPLTMLHASGRTGCVSRYVLDEFVDPVMHARIQEVWVPKFTL